VGTPGCVPMHHCHLGFPRGSCHGICYVLLCNRGPVCTLGGCCYEAYAFPCWTHVEQHCWMVCQGLFVGALYTVCAPYTLPSGTLLVGGIRRALFGVILLGHSDVLMRTMCCHERGLWGRSIHLPHEAFGASCGYGLLPAGCMCCVGAVGAV
jgi:hypothetical protein